MHLVGLYYEILPSELEVLVFVLKVQVWGKIFKWSANAYLYWKIELLGNFLIIK